MKHFSLVARWLLLLALLLAGRFAARAQNVGIGTPAPPKSATGTAACADGRPWWPACWASPPPAGDPARQ